MQNNTKDQHFVPVCYLRNFCEESEQTKSNPKVWRFDKLSKRSEFKGIQSFCYSNKLYSINRKSESLINKSIKDKETFFESHYLHDIEQKYSVLLKDVISSVKQRKFGGDMKIDLSLYIAIQYLRDPIIKLLLEADEGYPYFSLSEDYKKLLQNRFDILEDPSMKHFMYGYGNKEMISTITRSLATSVWTIHYNPNDVFFTSDNPVCLAQDKPSSHNEGDIQRGKLLHIIFPVSKNILLQITQGVQINEIFYIDNTSQQQIDNFNFIQAYYAKKYVISALNSFSTIQDRIDNNPIIWDNKKLKIYG